MALNLLDGWFKTDLGEGAAKALIGFLFVVIGIVLIILIFVALGGIMTRVNARKKTEPAKPNASAAPRPLMPQVSADEQLPAEVVAVIAAAVAVCLANSDGKGDFVVRRIKRL